MSQYLVAVQLPDNHNRSPRMVDVLNEEMVAAGVRIFVGGLTPAKEAKSPRAQADGKVLATDGLYLETKEHIAVFGCSRSPAWKMRWRGGRRAVVACRVPVEVCKNDRRSGGKACRFFEIYD